MFDSLAAHVHPACILHRQCWADCIHPGDRVILLASSHCACNSQLSIMHMAEIVMLAAKPSLHCITLQKPLNLPILPCISNCTFSPPLLSSEQSCCWRLACACEMILRLGNLTWSVEFCVPGTCQELTYRQVQASVIAANSRGDCGSDWRRHQ